MHAKKQPLGQEDLFRNRLDNIIDHRHSLFKLAHRIDWSYFEREFGPYYVEAVGRPGKPIRLMVGLHYLKYTFNESDESVVERFIENPYWQYFCGFEYFQHEFPLDPTSLVKWRQRIGEEGFEKLLSHTIDTAIRSKLLRARHCAKVTVDTTVQEKAITFPTDAGLYHRMREKLVAAAEARGIHLRQSYRRLAKRSLLMKSRYAHAKQMRRAQKETKKLRTYLGRVTRDICRAVADADTELSDLLRISERLLSQKKDDKNKLYSIHAPEVECIAKGKAHKRSEFGCKVSVAMTSRDNWILGVQAHHGNPYDGHTLNGILTQAERITGHAIKEVYCDRGFRGHDYSGDAAVYITRHKKRRGPLSRTLKKWLNRRNAIEPKIGHLKADNRMDRNYLKGTNGDKINSLLAACGANLRKLLRAFFFPFKTIRNFAGNFNTICQRTIIKFVAIQYA